MPQFMNLWELPCHIRFHANCTRVESNQPGMVPHSHDAYELYFFARGKCSYMVENGFFDLFYGTVIFTRPGELHCVREMEPCEYERYYFYIPPDALSSLGWHSPLHIPSNPTFGGSSSFLMPPDAAERCHAHIQKARSALLSDQSERLTHAFAEFLHILAEVNEARDRADTPLRAQENNVILNDALRYISANIGAIASVNDLAQHLHVSREHLSRSFSGAMGVSLSRYLTLKRVELAKSLLEKGTALEEVYPACGWKDYSHFITLFHREVGLTPAAYRRGSRIQSMNEE